MVGKGYCYNSLPHLALGKAIKYSLNQWNYLQNYLLEGGCEISNYRAEKSINPFVIGLKNFLFPDTVRVAQASAITYSMIVTANENKLNACAPTNVILNIRNEMEK